MLCVRRFEDEEEAVEAANRSDYGLSAAVMSSDPQRYGQSTCTVKRRRNLHAFIFRYKT